MVRSRQAEQTRRSTAAVAFSMDNKWLRASGQTGARLMLRTAQIRRGTPLEMLELLLGNQAGASGNSPGIDDRR